MSFRAWVSVITLVFLGLIIFVSRKEIAEAWHLLGSVNLWVLALLIPVQALVYFAAGEMMFSYLRGKGATKDISGPKQARMALEMNFVNHTLPSAGVSGISYMTWRLSHFGVSAGRATAAQIVRYVAGFASYIVLLLIAVAVITIDGEINRITILLSGMIMFVMLFGTVALIFLVSSKRRSEKFAAWVTKTLNKLVRTVTFGKKQRFVKAATIDTFFDEMHDEYLTLSRERKILLKPFLWGFAFNAFDVLLFAVTFWALGTPVNPAAIIIAYGLASIAGFIVVTPGGAGVYEAIMVSFLATAGIAPGVAIAGILLTRIAVLAGTIGFGYLFYQHAILRHGKAKPAA